ncbi:DUF559 domain-containing protein [Georgenia faecalis]|uniref:DUF559 domain-containing protein n=1 Tax=Georgenia faecalis TaxID=2483799 RepID=UPI0013E0A7FF|nr:DUF559 domain-containing protein [Georgenia faecalis]
MTSTVSVDPAEALRRRAVAGVFTRAMAAECGFTRDAVRWRIASGRWVRVAGDCYAPAEIADDDRSDRATLRRAVAATLTWPDAVIAYRTAAAIFRLPVLPCDHTHVILPSRRASRAGLRVHLVPPPSGRDLTRFDGFRTTTRSGTMVDCLSLLPRREAESLLAWVRSRELITVRALQQACTERHGRWGITQLRELTAMAARGALSTGELRLHEVLSAGGLTGWEPDQPIVVGGRIIARADVLFRDARVIVELDGRAFHADFQGDRRRMNALVLAGYTVLRFTWADLTDRPTTVVAQVRAALRRVAPTGR